VECNVDLTATFDALPAFSERNMTLADTAPAAEPHTGLRERKKLATRRSLRRHALDLVAQRGFMHVTVEDIAEAADVSPRTFFNYFPSKEAALFGADPERLEALREGVLHLAPGEPALDALRQAMVAESRVITRELSDLGGDPQDMLRRMKAVRADPHLRAAQSAHMASLEAAVSDALAERLGTDPARDPYPGLLASIAGAVIRATTVYWASSGGVEPLDRLTDRAFQALADGLPEHCSLRPVTRTVAPGKDEE
jgi:AcrR family transcriptional regulator